LSISSHTTTRTGRPKVSDAALNPIGVEVAEQFSTSGQQRHAGLLGMWVFLVTELLLFSGLLLTALVLRVMYPQSVINAGSHLKFWIGAGNSVVLIVSSLTMAMAIEFSKLGRSRDMIRCMLATSGLGFVFLCLKGFEYYKDYEEHMTPFLQWRQYALANDHPTVLFVDLYYIATSLHAVHMTIGISLLMFTAWQASHSGYLARRQNRIEIVGLYWHFIDLVWIMVFATLYLVNR